MLRTILILLMLFASATGFATEFFVASSGDDANLGSQEKPFATLARARDAVRTLRSAGTLDEPVRVTVADGRYTLSEPFVLLPEDSGTDRSPVIYQAAVGARPVFSGGREIRGWQRDENGLWTVRIPEVAAGQWYFEQLFVNGRRATRARTSHISVDNNIVYWDSGTLLSGPWDKVNHVSQNNCYWNVASGKVAFVGKSLDQWQAAGHEQSSIIADPKLEDPQQDNFQLKPDSPALRMGFKPFDYSRAGVHGDAEWIRKANEVEYPPLEIAPEPPPPVIE